MIHDLVVKDSSIWHDNNAISFNNERDNSIKIGIVKGVSFLDEDRVVYDVETYLRGGAITITKCYLLQRMDGAYNYEEFSLQSYMAKFQVDDTVPNKYKAGDNVVIAYLHGDSRKGVILGCLKHPSRDKKIGLSEGQAYISEFNGLETSINNLGEYKITAKGVPLNQALLSAPATGVIPPPIYNQVTGGSYIELDKLGSITLSDASKTKEQYIKIDKTLGQMSLFSGATTTIELNKYTQDIKLNALKITENSVLQHLIKTTKFNVDSNISISLKAPKIAIGINGIELLDQIVKLIDAIGQMTVMAPFGPTSVFKTSPMWAQIELIKTMISQIKGSL